tara:strand:+ start:2640 stop:3038 length:399 start_codon:yes stop_codon:yes gene_type:complete
MFPVGRDLYDAAERTSGPPVVDDDDRFEPDGRAVLDALDAARASLADLIEKLASDVDVDPAALELVRQQERFWANLLVSIEGVRPPTLSTDTASIPRLPDEGLPPVVRVDPEPRSTREPDPPGPSAGRTSGY